MKVKTIALFLLTTTLCLGQTTSFDSTYIRSFADKLMVRLNLDQRTETFSWYEESDDESFILDANTQLRTGITLGYDNILLTVSHALKFIPDNKDDHLKGKSSFRNYGARLFLGQWNQILEYRWVKGFYLQNTEDFDSTWVQNRDPYFIYPNLKSVYWGGSTAYIFNPNFSLRQILNNTEWQLKSAGSFIPAVHYGYGRITDEVSGESILQENFDVRIALGYHFTWVIHKNWFLAPNLAPSLGLRYSRYRDATDDIDGSGLVTYLDGGIQIGYISEKIVLGFNFDFNSSLVANEDESSFANDQTFARFYIGYRFPAPKFLRKNVDKVKDELQFDKILHKE